MRGPKPPPITLSQPERQELEHCLRCHATPQQIALRARIVLSAALGMNNSQIARHLAISRDMARLWRRRWIAWGAVGLDEVSLQERLCDRERPGRPCEITAEQQCQIAALACEAPAQSGRPISQWSAAEIAEEIMRRGIVSSISRRHAARLLKKQT